ncbi:uncharacterized protein METZ01_LOCUS103669, partial [marine metagenome]
VTTNHQTKQCVKYRHTQVSFTRGMSMAIVNFLSDIRNAAIANAVIVVFHVYIAFAVEGVSFLVIVLPIGGLIAAAYFVKG